MPAVSVASKPSAAAGRCAASRAAAPNAWGVWTPTRRRRACRRVAVVHPDQVGQGGDRDRAADPGSGLEHRLVEGDRGERARRVVHRHHVDLAGLDGGREVRERGPLGAVAGRAAGDHRDHGAVVGQVLLHRLAARHPARRRGRPARPASTPGTWQAVRHRARDDRDAGQREQHLVDVRAHPRPRAGGEDDDGGPHQVAAWTRAVAIAATPSPRPVRPSPSVVVADSETGAPTAPRSGPRSPRRAGDRAAAGCRSPGPRRSPIS